MLAVVPSDLVPSLLMVGSHRCRFGGATCIVPVVPASSRDANPASRLPSVGRQRVEPVASRDKDVAIQAGVHEPPDCSFGTDARPPEWSHRTSPTAPPCPLLHEGRPVGYGQSRLAAGLGSDVLETRRPSTPLAPCVLIG